MTMEGILENLMRKTLGVKILVGFLFPLAVLFAAWGYAYEFTYFITLGLNVNDVLTVNSYMVSSGRVIAFIVLSVMLFVHITKFFTKNIHEDDVATLKSRLSERSFANEIVNARISCVISVLFWLVVCFGRQIGIAEDFSHLYMYLIYVNATLFSTSLLLSPPHAKITVLLLFSVSIALCFSAGGYGNANYAMRNEGVVRDDMVVKIINNEGELEAKAASIPFKLPYSK